VDPRLVIPPWRPQRMAQGDWESFERMARILEAQTWTFAKTMPQNPHWYTLRKQWANQDDEWLFVIDQVRRYGYFQNYAGLWYTSHDVQDHFYWVMGGATLPVATYGKDYALAWPATFIINRKPLTSDPSYAVPYDAIADRYVTLLHGPESLAENEAVFSAIGDAAGLDVLDVGCGTGVAWDYLGKVRSYLGVDPSEKMLAHLRAKHPHAETVRTSIASWVPPKEHQAFDLVLALFGTGSYLTDPELVRLQCLLRPGGLAAVMFYTEKSVPTTYIKTGIHVPHRPWAEGIFPGETEEVGNGILCLYRRPL
jgi:2-polyprenyl-3-methyl-5-hydroxy-6-metoxy-1,4-benzoquinol methylase